MSPSGAWRRLLRRPSSPPDATRGAAARWLRRGLLALLAASPLLAALPFEAAAQTTPTANADGSYTVPRDWALKPSAVARGAKFRLLFITDTWHNASDTSISRYDTHVQYWAARGHSAIVPYGAKFKAIGSTATVDARAHVGATGAGVPIYWLNGARVANNYTDFWDGSWDANAGSDRRNRLGQANNTGTRSDWPWTGTKANGTKSAHPLGSPTPTRGAFGSDSPIEQHAGAPNTQTHAFYALSPVFLVEPVPVITIEHGGASVTEGTGASFTLTASPAPIAHLPVSVSVHQFGHYLASGERGTRTVTIAANQTSSAFTVATVNDEIDEHNGSVTATVLSGTGYTKGTPSARSVAINDNDDPSVSLGAASYRVTEGVAVRVTLNLVAARPSATTVGIVCTDGTAGSADYTCPATVTIPANTASTTFSVQSTWDGVSEGDETFTVAIDTVPTGVRIGTPSSATVTIVNEDDHRPVISIARGVSPVTEGTAASFTLTASRAPTADLDVEVQVAEAFDEASYVAPGEEGTRTVTIPGGQATATFTVATVNNDVDEKNGGVNAAVLDGTGYRAATPPGGLATVVVRDNDDPVLRLGAADYGVTEGVAVRVTLNFRDRARTSATTVGITCTDGTAGHGGDMLCPATATIPAHARSHTFTITTYTDSHNEGKETFTVAIGSVPSGVRKGTPSSAVVTIADADVARPVVRVTPVTSPVTEGEEARFTVRRDIAGPAALTVALAGKTNGALFDSRLRLSNIPPKVTIPAGHSSVGFAVPTVDDGSDEADGWVKLWVQDSFSAYLGDYNPHPPENHGSYDTYVDRYDRNTHYPYETAGRHVAQVTVLDDEVGAPLPSAELNDYLIPGTGLPEGATGEFNLFLSRALETWETLTLPLTLGGDATRGADYTLRCRAAAGLSCRNLTSGAPSLTIDGAHFRGKHVGLPLSLTAIEDNTDEQTESVTLSLGGRAESINIVDAPDAVTIVFTRSSFEARENNNPAQPCMRVTPPSGRDIPLYFTLGGTATEGRSGDYYFPRPPVLTAGQRVACFNILAVDNTRDEPDKTVVLDLDTERLPSWVTLEGVDAPTLTIEDNEPTVVSLARTDSGAVAEGATVGFTVTLARALVAGEVVSVPLAVSGTGVTTADWGLALAAGTDLNTGVTLTREGTTTPRLRFAGAGARTATLTLETVRDGLGEGGAETFTVALGPDSRTDPNGFDHRDLGTNVNGGADPHPTHNRFTVTVNDGADPLPELTITGGPAVTEGTAATFTVTASPAPASDDTLIVNIGVADAPGADFLASSLEGDNGFWEFEGGVASRTFTLATEADDTDEPSGPVTVTLRPRAGEYTVGTPASATVTVNDDDNPAPTVSFGGADYSTAEGDAASVTVRIHPRRSAPTAVGLTYTHGTAASGDYTAAPASVTIPANAASHTFTVQTTEDPNDEPDETFTIAIGTLPTGVATGSPSSTTVTITDDDTAPTPTVSFAVASYSTAEGAAASVTVRISPTRASPTAVGLTYADVEAEAGDDYTAAPASVTIPANAASHTFTVQTADDSADESDETFTLAIGTLPAGVATGSPSSTTVTISDDDDPPPVPVVTIAHDASSVTEGTAAAFTVSASVAPVSDLAVTVEVAEGPGGDFVASGDEGTKTATIGAGETSTTLSVTTVDDTTDEPGAQVTATVADGSGYTVGAEASATVAVADGDPTTVALTGTTSAIAEDGGAKTLTLTLNRALVAGERLDLPVVVGGVARHGADYRLPCVRGLGCRYLGDTGGGVFFLGGPDATGTATLTLTAIDDADDEGTGETVTVGLGTPGGNLDGGATASGSVSFNITDDDDPLPVITIAGGAAVTEGGDAVFTLSADRAPSANLAVKVEVEDAPGSDFLAEDDEGADTVTLGAGLTSATYTVPTVDDTVDEPDGPVRATLAAGAGYRRGTASSATVEVADDDATVGPTLSIDDATHDESEGQRSPFNPTLTYMPFTIRLSAPQSHTVRVTATTRDSTPVSARVGQDYQIGRMFAELRPGQTATHVWVQIVDDSHDEDPETFEVVLSDARGAAIADPVAVGTITNDDPMPAAWLARFGRTVAEQALDGIAGRLAAPRNPGMQGTLAGLPLGGAPGTWSGAGPGLAPGGDGTGVTGSFDARPDPLGTGGFGHDAAGFGNGFDETEPQSQTLTMRDALLGSRFTLTGAADASGGSLAFWGRAAHGSFDGREGTFSLDGEATTALLGADYARDRWLVGLALAQSEGEGAYRDTKTAPRPASQACPDGAGPLCGEAVREGDGTVEASLTAALPYASLQASKGLKLWGALGYGEGEVTLKTAPGGRYRADTTWRMAAAGLRGDLLEAPVEGSGPALALTSDALWARTASEKTRDLAASASDVTRLRLGLEGSWRFSLDGGDAGAAPGASLTPKLEVGARHDGGDAETGFGAELGGGIAWVHPALGLTLDVSGRTLIAHEDGDLEDRGFAAALGFDPRPETERGPSFSLRQDFGGPASGGLDALFQSAPLDERSGGEATSRWTAEAAYGLPAFGGRYTGSPHAGLGLSPDARDYTLGWRWTPARSAPDLTFGVKATRRESDGAAPEHALGFEASARW